MNYREATIRGILGAAHALDTLGIKEKIKNGLQQVDIFESLKELNIITVCRPLDGLLGAYTAHNDTHGVLVSTNRRLPVQRFTAAHELGHFWLKHGTSLDNDDSINRARNYHGGAPLQEIEAEAFASEFILPKSLFVYTFKRQGYTKSDLRNPDIIYQLSLRLGASYSATRVAMQNHNFINRNQSQEAATVTPKMLKEKLLKEIGIKASHPDVFHLTEKDNGSYILSGPEDIIIIDLEEHSASGYSWTEVSPPEIKTLHDLYSTDNDPHFGGCSNRKLFIQGRGVNLLNTKEKRPWESCDDAINKFDVTLDFRGQEVGLPRAYNQ